MTSPDTEFINILGAPSSGSDRGRLLRLGAVGSGGGIRAREWADAGGLSTRRIVQCLFSLRTDFQVNRPPAAKINSVTCVNNRCCQHSDMDYLAKMDWQQIVSLLIVAVTVGAFLRARLRRGKFKFERDTHCGCVSSGPSAARSSIVFHARKGERARIIVKSS